MSHVAQNLFSILIPYFLSENLAAVSDEQGERCHQDIHSIEYRYLNDNMMADYCQMLHTVTFRSIHTKEFKIIESVHCT